jgi:hypothetical protein
LFFNNESRGKEVSVNAHVNIARKLLHQEPSVNNPRNEPPVTNDFLPSIEFLNPSAITQAGVYDRIIKLPEPVKPWHRASRGATERFKGCLSDVFPELKNLSEEDLKEIKRERHEL